MNAMTTNTHTNDFHEIIARQARQNAVEAMGRARYALQQALREMDGYIERFEAADNDADRARIVNWTIQHLVSNVYTNMRIDLLANSQAELAKLDN